MNRTSLLLLFAACNGSSDEARSGATGAADAGLGGGGSTSISSASVSSSVVGSGAGPAGTGGSSGGGGGEPPGGGGRGGSGGAGECVVGGDCPGQDTECSTRYCDAGVCYVDYLPAGTVLVAQVPSDCNQVECDGAGGTIDVDDDLDLPPDDGKSCTVEGCANGSPTSTPNANGTPCMDAFMGHCFNGSCVQCETDADCSVSGSPGTCGSSGICDCIATTDARCGCQCGAGTSPFYCGATPSPNTGACTFLSSALWCCP